MAVRFYRLAMVLALWVTPAVGAIAFGSSPSPGTPGEGGVRVSGGAVNLLSSALLEEPSPQSSPGVPGEEENRGKPGGAAKFSLPLEGYYRVGRYMPVKFSGGGGQTVTLAADGTITTVIDSATSGIAPWLMLRDDVRWDGAGQALHSLAEDERLVGCTEEDFPADLFPGRKIVHVRFDAAAMSGPLAAWQALDAVALDYVPGNQYLTELIAGGTTVAVRSDRRPDIASPWRQDGAWWVLDGMSQLSARPSDAVFDCLAGWAPGLFGRYRREIVIAGVAMAMVLLGLRLWKSKWAAWCALVFSAGCGVGFIAWGGGMGRSDSAVAEVNISSSFQEINRWLFWRARKPFELHMPWDGTDVMLPILPEHGAGVVEVRCGSDGQPREIYCRLDPGRKMAMVSEHVESVPGKWAMPVDSPMKEVVRAEYPGYRILGQSPGTGGAGWGTVWIAAKGGAGKAQRED